MSEEIIEEKEFDAFISYSRHDSVYAESLLKELENFDPPKIDDKQLQTLNIFRDTDDLEAGGDYYKTIEGKLAKSNKLIVICSPRSRVSPYVNDEIRKFTKIHSANNILPVIVEGIPNNEATSENEHLKAFPEALVEATEMPLAVNLVDTGWPNISFTKDILRGAWYSILAKIYDISRDKIERRAIQKRKQKNRQKLAVVSVLTILFALLVFLWVNDRERLLTLDKSYTQAKIFEEKAGRSAQQQSAAGYQKAWLYTFAALKQEIDTNDVKKDLKESKARLQRKAISGGASIDQMLWASSLSPETIKKLIVSPSGRYMVTIDDNDKLYLWDNRRGEQIYSWIPGKINSLCFSPDDKYLISWTNSVLTLWAIDKKDEKVRKIKSHYEKNIHLVTINPESDVAAFYVADTIKSWRFDLNFFTGLLADSIITMKQVSNIKQLAFTADGEIIFVDGSGSVKIESIEIINSINPDVKIAVASGKNLIAYSDSKNNVYIWDFENDPILKLESVFAERLIFNKNADKLAITSQGSVHIFRYSEDSELGNKIEINDTTLLTNTISFFNDSTIVGVKNKSQISIWHVNEGKEIATTSGHFIDVNRAVFHPEQELIASGADDGTVILWDTKTGYEKRRFFHKPGVINGLDFSNNGKHLIAGIKEIKKKYEEKEDPIGAILIWDVESGSLASVRSGTIFHRLWDLDFNPHDSLVVVARDKPSKNLLILDLVSDSMLFFEGHTKGVRAAKFNSTGTQIASVSDDGTVCLWDVASRKLILQWNGHNNNEIYGIDWSPDDEYIVTTSTDETIRKWELDEILLKFKDESEAIKLSFSSQNNFQYDLKKMNDRVLIFKGNDQWYVSNYDSSKKDLNKLWKITSSKNKILAYKYKNAGKEVDIVELSGVGIFRGHLDEVWRIVFSPNGKLFASSSGDNTIRLWFAKTGVEIAKLQGHTRDIFGIDFSKDGKSLVSASLDGQVRLWSIDDAYNNNYIKTFADTVRAVAIDPDNRFIAYGGHDKQIYIDIIDSDSTGLIRSSIANRPFRNTSGYDVLSLTFHPKEPLLVFGTTNNEIKFWDYKSAKKNRIYIPPIKVDGDVLSLDISLDGSIVAALSNGVVYLKSIDSTLGNTVDTNLTKTSKSKARSVAFSPDGKYLAAGFSSSDKSIMLFKKVKTNRWEFVKTLGHHSDGVWCVAFSPNSKYLVSGSWDSSIRIWDVYKEQKVLTLRGHSGPVTSAVFLDSTTLASGSWDHSIRLWNTTTGIELEVINAHKGTVFSLAADPKWRYLISGSADKTMRIHEVRPDIESKSIDRDKYALLFDVFEKRLPFSLDGDELRDSQKKYVLNPLTKTNLFRDGIHRKWILEPRPQKEKIIDWITADSKLK